MDRESLKREQSTSSDGKPFGKTETGTSIRQSGGSNPAILQRTPTNVTVSGSSIVGLLASKKLAKRLTSRFFSGQSSSSRLSVPLKVEPTYRMEPRTRVQVEKISPIVDKILQEKLEGHCYDSKICNTMCQSLSDEIKEKVKRLKFDRYKLVTHVLMGELRNQGMQVSSRCVWDDTCDDFATCNYQGKDLFCTVTVYGVYHEWMLYMGRKSRKVSRKIFWFLQRLFNWKMMIFCTVLKRMLFYSFYTFLFKCTRINRTHARKWQNFDHKYPEVSVVQV